MEGPGFGGDACFPVTFRTRLPGNRPGRAGHVKALVDHDRLGHQDDLGLAAPSPQLDHHQRQVLGESVQRWPIPASYGGYPACSASTLGRSLARREVGMGIIVCSEDGGGRAIDDGCVPAIAVLSLNPPTDFV